MKLIRQAGLLVVLAGLLLGSGCSPLPDEARDKVAEAVYTDHDLNFLYIDSVKRVWRPELIFDEDIDRLWCVVAAGEWDEGIIDVHLWVIESNSTYVLRSASEAGFEKAGCKY